MAESSRLETLRRRVQQDPASFAFAALAEEYRRAGRLDEAEEICRQGLERHPTYTAGRVTLGRTLAERGDVDGAAAEFEHVLRTAPENLLARRGLGDILRRRGDLGRALDELRVAASLAPQDAELGRMVEDLETLVPPVVAAPRASRPLRRQGPNPSRQSPCACRRSVSPPLRDPPPWRRSTSS
jgi:tetratricopeptide (TPR) repeat protein